MTYPHFPKPAKGAKVVGYAPLTGQPKHEDGTLKIALQYEHPTRGRVTETVEVDDPVLIEMINRGHEPNISMAFHVAPVSPAPAKRRPRSVLDLERDPAYRANPGDQAGPDQGQLV